MRTISATQAINSTILRNAWAIARKAFATFNLGTVREYLAAALKQAWSEYKSKSSKLRAIAELNASATKLYSDNSRVFLGAELDENNDIVIAPKGLEVAAMLFGGARKNLNAWVRDEKMPEHTAELAHELRLMDSNDSVHVVTISEGQSNWLKKVMFNGFVAKVTRDNVDVSYSTHQATNGLFKLKRIITRS